MTFVNEYIPAEDIEKYEIKKIDDFFLKGHYQPTWTIDRERNIYLRYLKNGREEAAQDLEFYFYWQGHAIFLRVHVDGGGKRGGPGWSHYSFLRMGRPEVHFTVIKEILLPDELKQHQAQIIADLKDALIAFKDFGVHSTRTESATTFDF
jgi:hypothetical protein